MTTLHEYDFCAHCVEYYRSSVLNIWDARDFLLEKYGQYWAASIYAL
jgi:hypothetical protein